LPSSTELAPIPRTGRQPAAVAAIRAAVEEIGTDFVARHAKGSALDPTLACRQSVLRLVTAGAELIAESGCEASRTGLQSATVDFRRCSAPRPPILAGRERELAASIVGSPASPYDAIAGIYEAVLSCQPRLEAGRMLLDPGNDRRKADGCYYTPRSLARLVVERTIEALPPRPVVPPDVGPTVFDPAMGSGVFLLEAVRTLAGASDQPEAVIAERCVYGVDLDPVAVRLAILALCLETGARPEILARHLRCADALALRPRPWRRFDLVVGNPPWGARYPAEQHAELRRRAGIQTLGSFDSFKIFLAIGARRSDGAVGMVLPQAMLAQETHADIRHFMLARFDPYYVAHLGDRLFPGAAAPACALVFGPRPGPAVPRYERMGGLEGGESTGVAPTVLVSGREGFLVGSSPVLRLLRRLQASHPALGDLAHLYRVRDVGINYNRASAGRRVLYGGDEAESPLDRPRYRGRDFDRYTAIGCSGWLRHEPARYLAPGETLSYGQAVFELPEKVVFRQTADRIVATLDRSRMAMGRSVIAITREADASLLPLLACLNSQLLTALYRLLAGEEGRVLPQVKVGRMQALPVPLPAEHDPGWPALEALAAEMLRTGGCDRALDRRIDRAVCALYGLDAEEMAALGPA